MITIFTTNTCAYCKMVKKYLANKGHEYTEVNLDEQPERRDEAYNISGALTVPVTIIGKSVITGWNLPKLVSALAEL